MLRQLRLQNYRCFSDHRISFRSRSVVVGRNNAGKPTIVEGLTIVSQVVNKLGGLNFGIAPEWLGLPRFSRCASPSFEDLDLNLRTIFHRYSDPPAIVTATFDSGDILTVYVGRERKLYAMFKDSQGRAVRSKSEARGLHVDPIHVLPQVGPLAADERVLNADYVKRSMNTRLASIHFRNQILLLKDRFEGFQQLAESTWHHLRVNEPETTFDDEGSHISMFIGDGDFTAEVAWMGHGLQMWLQTMWFLARVPEESTVILDEPDVYMHPDLQRKLYRLVHRRFKQTIVATHSVEIMAEAEPKEILIVNRSRERSEYANSEPAVQHLIEHIGGIHNLHLARLWSARRLVLVEGDDLAILKRFHFLLFPQSETPLDSIPNMQIGGWSGWNYAVGSTMLVHNAVGERVIVYCILDSDYFLPEEIAARRSDAEKREVSLHVWAAKEIENYLLNAKAIQRLIAKRSKGKYSVAVDEVETAIATICEELKDEVVYGRMERYQLQERSLASSSAHKKAKQELDRQWSSNNERKMLTPGKAALARLSAWAQERFQVSFGATGVAYAFRAGDLPEEIRSVITAIEESRPFPL